MTRRGPAPTRSGVLAMVLVAVAAALALVWWGSAERTEVERPAAIAGGRAPDKRSALIEPSERHGPVETRRSHDPDEATRTVAAPGPTGRILGTLVDPDGAPIARAEVALFDVPLFGPHAATVDVDPRERTQTDANGRYDFQARHADRHAVAARAMGYFARARNQSPDVDTPFELRPSGRLTGLVSSFDAGRAGVRVTLVDEARWDGTSFVAAPSVTTGPLGRFAFDQADPGGGAVLHIAPSGHVPFLLRVVEHANSAGETIVDVRLDETFELTIEVVDSPESIASPVAQAQVRIGDHVGAWYTRTGFDGRAAATFEGLPARWLQKASEEGLTFASEVEAELAGLPTIDVHAPGFCTSTAALSNLVDAFADKGSLRIPLARARVVRGVVRDAEGPIPNARLRWYGAPEFTDVYIAPAPGSEVAISGADGSFEFPGVPVGSHRAGVLVHPTDDSDGVFQLVDLPANADTPAEIEIRL